MIREINRSEIPECVVLIRESFLTVANEFNRKIGEQLLNHCFTFAKGLGISKIKIGIVEENTQLRKWYEAHGFIHIKTEKYAFFPFTCGYMEQNIQQSTK